MAYKSDSPTAQVSLASPSKPQSIWTARETNIHTPFVKYRTSGPLKIWCAQCFCGTIPPSRNSVRSFYLAISYWTSTYLSWEIFLFTPHQLISEVWSFSSSEKSVVILSLNFWWTLLHTLHLPFPSFLSLFYKAAFPFPSFAMALEGFSSNCWSLRYLYAPRQV